MDFHDILEIVSMLCLAFLMFDIMIRYRKTYKENIRLREELIKQVNENLKLQNNFDTDSVE